MAKPKIDRVQVDRTEYEALCDLRDGAHEKLKLECARLRENFDACTEVNRSQVTRLSTQSIELDELRAKVEALTRENARLNSEVEKWKPATSSVPQPALGKK